MSFFECILRKVITHISKVPAFFRYQEPPLKEPWNLTTSVNRLLHPKAMFPYLNGVWRRGLRCQWGCWAQWTQVFTRRCTLFIGLSFSVALADNALVFPTQSSLCPPRTLKGFDAIGLCRTCLGTEVRNGVAACKGLYHYETHIGCYKSGRC